MQLGDIFESDSVPVVGREVKFHVLKSPPGEPQRQALAEAVFWFVDEPTRHESARFADEYLRNDPLYKKHGIIPEDRRTDEECYAFLIRALRDKDDPTRAFCPPNEYAAFRKALIAPVVAYLMSEYKKYVADEYPELATPEQVEELVDQALGK